MHERGEKNNIASDKRLRGLNLKLPIAKKRKEGANIHIQYNDDGDRVGEGEEKHEAISEKRFQGPNLKLEISKKITKGANIPIHYNDDGDIVGEGEVKYEITSEKRFRCPTLKLEIAKKRTERAKIQIEYNNDGDGVGEGYVQLVSYLGVLARTMVPVYHTDWRVVPIQLKEKLWDCVKVYNNILNFFSCVLFIL